MYIHLFTTVLLNVYNNEQKYNCMIVKDVILDKYFQYCIGYKCNTVYHIGDLFVHAPKQLCGCEWCYMGQTNRITTKCLILDKNNSSGLKVGKTRRSPARTKCYQMRGIWQNF